MTIETRLAEIRARAEKATLGPWDHYSINLRNTSEQAVYSVPLDADPLARGSEIAGPMEPRDAEFIAHARTDVPWLLGQVELRDKALDAVLELHQPEPHCNNVRHTNPDVECPECAEYCTADGELCPCRTVTVLTAPLEVKG